MLLTCVTYICYLNMLLTYVITYVTYICYLHMLFTYYPYIGYYIIMKVHHLTTGGYITGI